MVNGTAYAEADRCELCGILYTAIVRHHIIKSTQIEILFNTINTTAPDLTPSITDCSKFAEEDGGMKLYLNVCLPFGMKVTIADQVVHQLVNIDRQRHTASIMTMAGALRFPRMTNNFYKLVNEVGYLAFAVHVCDCNEFELLCKKSKRNKPNKRVYFVTQKEVDEAWRALCESTFAVWPAPEDWSEERKQKYLETQLSQV